MRISELNIRNFKAISALSLSNLQEMVIIAGPNGCGKSCVFDAIRLLKSAYGGYQPNEWQQWFGEFQLNVNNSPAGWLSILQDPSKDLEISAKFVLSETERQYIKSNAEVILAEQAWREFVPELINWRYIGASPFAANMRTHEPRVKAAVAERLPILLANLEDGHHIGKLYVKPNGQGATADKSLILEILFGRYDPQNIGIIDYHGANRTYSREQVGGIHLSIEQSDERMRQHALYNSSGKYSNLKSEMAGTYVRQLLSREANGGTPEASDLSDTLKELFTTFFPGKEFLGPQPTPDGKMLFPVRTARSQHDIDDLSSGEKEVLYGYLRLRNAAPKNSVLLIDEPELHLNPRLIQGLASFYHQHLGRALSTQLWLVTHSDTLIREAVGQEGFSVFHMQPIGPIDLPNQASSIQAAKDLDRLVLELVGDLAAYRPGAKIVIFEGDSESEFDVRMTATLFPEFQASINAISGGNKRRVEQLYELLEEARSAGHLPGKFYAITDADGEYEKNPDATRRHSWDVYHIENYLLEPKYISMVLRDINSLTQDTDTQDKIFSALRICAQDSITNLVSHRLRTMLNEELVPCLDLRFDPKRLDLAAAFREAIQRSFDKISEKVNNSLSTELLTKRENDLNREIRSDIENGQWVRTFRGRDILKKFVGKYGGGLPYETFRDLIIARMRDDNYRPSGMKNVIDTIANDT